MARNQFSAAVSAPGSLSAVTYMSASSSSSPELASTEASPRPDPSGPKSSRSGSSGVQIAAGHDATLDAATIGTKTGDLTLAAGHDLTLNAEGESHEVVTDTKKKKSGLLSSKTTINVVRLAASPSGLV